MHWRLESFIENNLPKGKETFSRDAVEILLKLLWKEAGEDLRIQTRDESRHLA